MNHTLRQNLISSFIAIAYAVIVIGCSNKLEEYKTGSISSPLTIGIRNLTVVEIIPDKTSVKIDWKGYNTLTSNALNVGFERVVFSDSKQTFFITDKGMGNNELSVNGKTYRFDASNKHIEIRFGKGVSIVPGSDYQAAKHVYDVTLPEAK